MLNSVADAGTSSVSSSERIAKLSAQIESLARNQMNAALPTNNESVIAVARDVAQSIWDRTNMMIQSVKAHPFITAGIAGAVGYVAGRFAR